jgi:hemolysin III
MSILVAFFQFREPVNAWSHALWLLLSVPATMVLLRRCPGNDRARRLTLLVFGVSLAVCYAGSTVFHAARVSERWIARFDELDHIGIFVLIAGSYTPVSWNLLQGRLKWGTLAAAWFFSALGTALLLTCGVFSMFWSTCWYVGLGWGAAIGYIELSRARPQREIFLLLLGGVLYTVGAIINLANWPVLSPGVFGAHELFHLFVMAGSLAHFLFMHGVIAQPAHASGASGWLNRASDLSLLTNLAAVPVPVPAPVSEPRS